MAYEALNNAASLKSNFIIVLNDNEMSITENVGGMSSYLSGLRTASAYTDFKMDVTKGIEPHSGHRTWHGGCDAEDEKAASNRSSFRACCLRIWDLRI